MVNFRNDYRNRWEDNFYRENIEPERNGLYKEFPLVECGKDQGECTVRSIGNRLDLTDKIVADDSRSPKVVREALRQQLGVKHLTGIRLPNLSDYLFNLNQAREAFKEQEKDKQYFEPGWAILEFGSGTLGYLARAAAALEGSNFLNETTKKPIVEMANQVVESQLAMLKERIQELSNTRYSYEDMEKLMHSPLFQHVDLALLWNFISPEKMQEIDQQVSKVVASAMWKIGAKASQAVGNQDSSQAELKYAYRNLKFCLEHASYVPAFESATQRDYILSLFERLEYRIGPEGLEELRE